LRSAKRLDELAWQSKPGPETELNFKVYRQAPNKIIGISDEASLFLDGFV
jgi:hypothetical protein